MNRKLRNMSGGVVLKASNIVVNDIVLGFVVAPTNQTDPFLPEMNFLEQGENSWPSPAVATSSERACAARLVKASRWTRQEAVEEAEPPGLGEGEAKVSSGDRGQQEFRSGT